MPWVASQEGGALASQYHAYNNPALVLRYRFQSYRDSLLETKILEKDKKSSTISYSTGSLVIVHAELGVFQKEEYDWIDTVTLLATTCLQIVTIPATVRPQHGRMRQLSKASGVILIVQISSA